jgi:hypothetical protein
MVGQLLPESRLADRVVDVLCVHPVDRFLKVPAAQLSTTASQLPCPLPFVQLLLTLSGKTSGAS